MSETGGLNMCLPYRNVTLISEIDVKTGADFERDGHWFRVHFVRDGKVYFICGRTGEDGAREAAQMPIEEFVKQYNKGK